ncbi:hypothetical protein ACFQLX_18225 [Streptomyces polyrhachis]|uniref:Dienelactone hydrolase domain-containing protein n=1 Tax=Streptomyces polyrhachis TaxID=1282885 RepID=A0ABW2GH94_9ACTN
MSPVSSQSWALPEIAATVEEFLSAAKECEAAIEVIDLPEAHHGYETQDPTDTFRAGLRTAMHAVLAHLRE